MTEPLDGTVALVTGASSGIGEAAARELARRGAAVAIAARRRDRLDALALEIERDGGRALAIEADVTDQEQVRRAVAETVDRLGRLDTVVNNAGVMLLGPIEDAPTEEWDRMIDLNLKGLLYVADAALPHLLRAAGEDPRHVADLVNISSVAGRIARRNSGVYNLTKHGVGAFSESLRQEVTGRHVRVSLVEPGAVETELPSHIREEIRDQMMSRLSDIERLEAADEEPRHVADLVNISSVAGRLARRNSGVYNLTKHGVGAFSESLRQEVTGRHVRVSLVEPGAVETELANHIREEIRDQMMSRLSDIERLEAADIADAIAYIVTRPRRVAINELLIRPTEQEG